MSQLGFLYRDLYPYRKLRPIMATDALGRPQAMKTSLRRSFCEALIDLTPKSGRRISLLAFVFSTAAAAPSAGYANDQEIVNDSESQISEIIVTARKREERLEDVPSAVSVIDASVLEQKHELLLQDFYTGVPGLSINDYGNGRISIAMRGLSTGDLGTP